MLEPYDGKLSRTVLRGEEGRKPLALPGRHAARVANGKENDIWKNCMKLIFEWDEVKGRDVDSSEIEERYINIGLSAKDRVLVLIHTERQGKIRIISCRRATAPERRHYEEG